MTSVLSENPTLVLLETFARAGVLGNTEVHFAHALHRLRPEEPDTVLLAAALAMRAPQWGHVCIEPTLVASTVVIDDGSTAQVEDLPWPDASAWAVDIANSNLVALDGSAHELRPLVWDGRRLYLHRYWEFEVRVAGHIHDRVHGRWRGEHDHQRLPSNFDALFPPAVPSQRRAAEAALKRSLSVITGGPGTGKTHTIAGVVAALLDSDAGERRLQIALAAPTGKAAQRLTESVQQGRSGASDAASDYMAALEAQTIHRLLGTRRGSQGTFVHDARNPLPVDVLIIDEMSMVSLPLMARLLDAVPPTARLILVGDPQQLASVEAGSVLRDLGDALPAWAMVELDQVFRQDESSPIIPLASAIHDGDTREVLRLLADPDTPLELIDPHDAAAMETLEAEAAEHAAEVAALAVQPDLALARLGEFRILTAARQGDTGRRGWTRRIEQKLATVRGGRHALRRWYPGRPVMVTENDYLNQLMNGDVGVVTDDAANAAGHTEVAFGRSVDVRRIAATRLQAVETVWAMTIHKSQGSEFGAVVISLPDAPSPLLSRELLYTAVTRARRRVVVVASPDALATAVKTRISRSSGLADRLAVDREDEAGGSELAEGPSQLSLWDLR